MKRMMRWTLAGVLAATMGIGTASAQTGVFEVGVQIPVERIGQLDSTDAGIGIRGAWNILPLVGVEGEINMYPGDIPDGVAVSGSRTEGLFGVTVGPRWNGWRPFVKLRPGFLRVGEAPEPVACPLIFPPTIACDLAAGATLFALDVGGGIEYSTGRTLVRFDIGDRMVGYDGPVIDRDGAAREDGFTGHDLRIAFGAGWRF